MDQQKRQHTLTTLANHLKGKGKKHEEIEEIIQNGILLAYTAAANDICQQAIIDTPLFYLRRENGGVKVTEAEGNAEFLFNKADFEITALDLYEAANVKDVNILLEGDTGVGKTITLNSFLNTTRPKKSFDLMRLSANIMYNDVFAPYTKVDRTAALPEVKVDEERIREKLTLFVDEQNRGDSNKILQLQDGVIIYNGKEYKIGVAVPKIKEDGTLELTDNIKKMWLVAAQNPSSEKDDKFTDTVENDAAIANRSVQVQYPSTTASTGASTLFVEQKNSAHKRFINRLGNYLEETLGTKLNEQELAEDWLSMFAFATAPEKTDKIFKHSSLEFADLLIFSLLKDKEKAYRKETSLIEQGLQYIKQKTGHKAQLRNANTPIDPTNSELKELIDLSGSLREDMINRDVSKLKNLTDLVSHVKHVKQLTREKTHKEGFEEYQKSKEKEYITIYDIATAGCMIANSKVLDSEELGNVDVSTQITNVLGRYKKIIDLQNQQLGITEKFAEYSPNHGIKYTAITQALQNTHARKKYNLATLTEQLCGQIDTIDSTIKAGDEISKILGARAIADIVTYACYLTENEKKTNEMLETAAKTAKDKTTFVQNFQKELNNHFKERYNHGGNNQLNTIYKHRMPRILEANLGE